ncbi:hypothetical protein [Haloarcula sp. Atlit-120R]|uniref:hypothetical protein n=1 Tax=Haloarcula sp. Atlit-120R TaxID=2282135 RepID=UPI000EF1ADCF|nr:hypothetical protein [Haloarcula sp. Atlit-120R]RLM32626.1 hypothetical protein DVK01_20345 [Haloarcula sp. Atlit-120R]
MSSDSERFGEFVQRQAQNRQQYSQKSSLKEGIEAANESLAVGQYHDAGLILRDRILPAVRDLPWTKPIELYHRELQDSTLPWHWSAVDRFTSDPTGVCARVARGPAGVDDLPTTVNGDTTDYEAAAKTIARTLASVESIASHHDVTAAELKRKADAMGHSVKLGEHKQKPDMSFGDPVSAIRTDLGSLKHYFTGGTGGGKSNAAGRQFEDYYISSLGEGRDYKCLDPAGLSTENVNAYDVPQWQQALRRAREEHDEPADWTDIEDYEPQAEFLVPLSPDLSDYRLPYDRDDSEFVPKPFTIPAAEVSADLYQAFLEPQLSDGEGRALGDAYRAVDNNLDDWSLDNLAREIRSRDGLQDSSKESAVRALQNLQSQGFIRTGADEHALSRDRWRSIFHSTDVITAINMNALERKESRYFVLSHLIERLWTLRIRGSGQPQLATWLRELSGVAPHREIRRKESEVVRNLMEFIVSKLYRIMRKPRDLNMEVLADTQDPGDVERGVRTRFNRYVVFEGSDSELKDIFSWSGQDEWYSLKNSLVDKPGHAGIVKGCEAASNTDRWGIGPVHLTPPSWHHHDKDEGPSGWEKRVQISRQTNAMHDEELRTPEYAWDLDGDGDAEAVDEDSFGEPDEADEPDDPSEKLSTKQYAEMTARQMYSHSGKSYEQITEEIPNNPDTGKPYDRSTIHGWVSDIEKGSGELVLDLESA